MKPGEPKYPELQNEPISDATCRAMLGICLRRLDLQSLSFTATELRSERESKDLPIVIPQANGNITVGRSWH